MYALNIIVFILLVIGGLNWGLVGLAKYNLIERIFTDVPVIARILFLLVGLAGIYAIIFFNWFVRPAEYHEEPEHAPHTPHTT